MPRYLMDAYEWIEYFIESQKGIEIGKIIEPEDNEIFTSVITIAEVSSIFRRENRDVDRAYYSILNLSKIYSISPEFSKEIGILHAEVRKKIKDFGMADATVLLSARKLGAKIITGDPHFRGFKETRMI